MSDKTYSGLNPADLEKLRLPRENVRRIHSPLCACDFCSGDPVTIDQRARAHAKLKAAGLR